MSMAKLHWTIATGAFLVLAWQAIAQQPTENGYAPDALSVADSDQTAVQYLPLPPSVEPLNSLLPKGGIGQSPAYLKKPERNLLYEHDVDFATREATVRARFASNFSKDTVDLWQAQYSELALYTMDMYDIGLNRIWLNALIG